MPSVYSAHSGGSDFPASYVKFLESGGARVVPIPYDLPASDVKALLSNINGALFTGGATAFYNKDGSPSQYALTAQIIFDEATTAHAAGESWPLWGTCLGHELISVLAAGLDASPSPLTAGWDAENLTLPVDFTPAAATSRLWGSPGAATPKALFETGLSYNAHTSGVAPADFAKSASLSSRFEILGTSADRRGDIFVATMEGKNGLPIYTTQCKLVIKHGINPCAALAEASLITHCLTLSPLPSPIPSTRK